jgi:hypothetical protein
MTSRFRTRRLFAATGAALSVLLASTGLSADNTPAGEMPGKAHQLGASLKQIKTQRVTWPVRGGSNHVPRGTCDQVKASLASGFDNLDVGSEITLQAGMVEQEGFGQTYIVPDPDPTTPQNEAFPIEVNLIEVIAATIASVSGSDGQPIQIGYTIEVYDGEPINGNTPIFSVESTNDPQNNPDLPLDLAIDRVPGSTCQPCNASALQASVAKLQFSVDPGAAVADRIIVPGNDQVNGVATGRFTVLFYLRKMADTTPYGACTFGITNDCGPLNRCNNGFMATESNSSGALNFASRNWAIFRSCGQFACAGGLWRFSDLSSGGGVSSSCRPSRDTLLQVSYTPSVCTIVASGACCTSAGVCSISTAAACISGYQGNGSVCAPNPCAQPSTGGCCVNGSCSVQTESACVGAGGVYQGTNISCANVTCGSSGGACCSTESSFCFNLSAAECAGNGIYQGNGTTCSASFQCPTGACCSASGTCTGPVSPVQCSQAGGTFKGTGTTCGPSTCPPASGACCLSTGACVNTQQSVCSGFGNTMFMAGATCTPNPCSQPGVCCRGTTCAIGVTQAGCTAPSGVGAKYTTAGASSGCNAGNNAKTPCCYADFDKLNGANLDDVFIYLNAWFAGSPYCKIAGDGSATPSLDDIFQYINIWFAGCS